MTENSKRKIFVSYKHEDENIQALLGGRNGTARDYVDKIEELFEGQEISKSEEANNDLSEFKNETIKSELRDKIYDSTVTIVLMTPGMKEAVTPQEDQFIPWEICFSLKNTTRNDRTSQTNAVLAVSIPDRYGNHGHAIREFECHRSIPIRKFFEIIKGNMFNKNNTSSIWCPICNGEERGPHSSYIPVVKWGEFVNDYDRCIALAEYTRDREDEYNMVKVI